MNVPSFDDDAAWSCWQSEWSIRDDTIYLNHGSFGPPPNMVRAARQAWQLRLDCQPMDFYVRRFEEHWLHARARLAAFVGTEPDNLVFVENATMGMNIVAANFPLAAGDQVVLNDHEYGAVRRIWERACRRAGADEPVIAQLAGALRVAGGSGRRDLRGGHRPDEAADREPHHVPHGADPAGAGDLCRARGGAVAVCIDGPHAPAQVPVDIDALGCDFYAASCHKWLSAPLGSGFLAVHPQYHEHFEPLLLSWGRLLPSVPQRWYEEFIWSGTRDPSSYLAVADAIRFLQQRGRGRVPRADACPGPVRTAVASSNSPDWSRRWPTARTGTGRWPWPRCRRSMPNGCRTTLWQQHGIEVPIIDFGGRQYVRVSCHLYNTPRHIATAGRSAAAALVSAAGRKR